MDALKFPMLTTILLLMAAPAFAQDRFAEADANGDKSIDPQEFKSYATEKLQGFSQVDQLFQRIDRNGDKSISPAEFEQRRQALQAMRSRGDNNRGNAPRRDAGGLRVGQKAPTFTLKSLDGESETSLADFQGKKPVVLIFGSYT